MKYIKTAAMLLILSCTLFATTTYVDPISALPNAKMISLGDAYTAIGGDIYSGFANPAGLSRIDNIAISAINTSTFEDVSLTSIACGYRNTTTEVYFLGYTTLGVASFKHLEYISGDVAEVGTIDNSNVALTFGYSKILNEKIRVGVLLNTFTNSLSSSYDGNVGYNGSGMSIDAGATYEYDDDLILGIVMKNILGGSVVYEDTEDEIAKKMVLGAGYLLDTDSRLYKLSFDYEMQSNGPKQNLMHLGVETKMNEMFVVRGGLNGEAVSNGAAIVQELQLTMGFGIKINSFNIDYAYFPQYGEGETQHFISVIYNLGNPKNSQVNKNIRNKINQSQVVIQNNEKKDVMVTDEIKSDAPGIVTENKIGGEL